MKSEYSLKYEFDDLRVDLMANEFELIEFLILLEIK